MDLIERLQDWDNTSPEQNRLDMMSASDEITRLRAENASLSAQLTAFQTVWPGGVDEVPSMIRTFLEKIEKLERGEYICKKCGLRNNSSQCHVN